jgi:hypothetical protein
MSSRGVRVLVVLVAACGNDGPGVTPLPLPDAFVGRPPDFMCVATSFTESCSGSQSNVTETFGAPNPMYTCMQGSMTTTATCASGCAVNGVFEYGPFEQPYPVVSAPQLCAEATEAKVGDACSNVCVPTRAKLGSDGTVLSELYLACESRKCVATSAPVVANYLKACDAATVAQYGSANVNGVVPENNPTACLLAWNGSAASSGITTKCIGDWQCPMGSLCDDEMTLLVTSSTPVAVCKPGPRGTLTPAMLSP